ncbi:TlpA family protein disulfide reductase [Panacibacter ginsenosidivorans]|uniref:TlpA family protein disulfide reductase n=1 Tax=Panacibacter ginsenosidivorans TaxID=1813871 RepID=A0A5B8VDC1_9BACT|nr:TlpA disulfide reductase family protein [Panacibacter ginsenosidivorans]QEC69312.1 TlpA family protein disulfide reductase [Panacibacter ginsenosidivorans]
MKQLLFLLLTITAITAQKSMAQSNPVGIGDQCPDLQISNIINYKTTTARISDFRGKLLILDFWATWCVPCLNMMPVAEKLQQQFDGQIQIMPVTDQPAAEVKSFLQKRAKTTKFLPPSSTADTELEQAFPHTVVPHYVWISPEGKVIAITSYGELTAANIQRMLGNNDITLSEKNDVEKIIDNKLPMFITANLLQQENGPLIDPLPNDAVLYHSVITKHLAGFNAEAGSGEATITAKNHSVGGLYRIAAGKYEIKMLLPNSTVWEVKDPAALAYADSVILTLHNEAAITDWFVNHSFCYELKFPSALAASKYDIMLADLNNYFGALLHIKGSIEKRKAKCLVLSRTGNGELLTSAGTEKQTVHNAYALELYNQGMYALVNFLSVEMESQPGIVDETGFTGKIDIQLNCQLSDPIAVNTALSKYGLQLKEEEREKDMIVIKDKD